MIKAKVNNGCVNGLREDSLVELWHKRLGHMSEKGLQILSKRDILASLKGTNMSLKPRTHCLAGSNIELLSATRPHIEDPMF